MRRLFFLFLLGMFLLSACGAPAATEMPSLPGLGFVTLTVSPMPELSRNTPLPSPLPFTVAPAEDARPTNTPLPPPTFTPFKTPVPTPTETLLPQLELPTEKPFAPSRVAWTGLPTYPADSEPGLLFRVDYDPDIWAQTEGNFGDIVLGHRTIPYCTVTPWTGRGLPMDWKVEHEFLVLGGANFDVNTVTFQDKVQFVAYVGGDKRIQTGFQVTFEENKEQCLADAEAIFFTLRSLAAVPTPTSTVSLETPTPEVSATP